MTAPLHPAGSLRERIEGSAAADVFRRLGVGARKCDLGDEGLYLAEELIEADKWLGSSDPEPLGVLVLALMIAQRQGSTRLPLDPHGHLKTLVSDIVRVAEMKRPPAQIIKAITALTASPRFGSLLGVGDARLPLIVDTGFLYTERSRWLEKRIAERLAKRLVTQSAIPATVIADLVAHPGSRALSSEQMHGVELALSGTLAVVTGGPGTGKTLVAAAIVRGLARLGLVPVALAAQTGKAANRLTEVLASELAAIAEPTSVDQELAAASPVATTLHRLLGYRGGSRGARFGHHAQSPLPVGALIVDEASMVDLELMDAILDALPATAPLILIGDANQLPAIDAGQILADLAGPGPARIRTATLEHSYRMDAADPRGRAVLAAATAIHDGNAQRITNHSVATPRTPGTLTFSGVEWIETGAKPADTTIAVADALWHHFDGPRALTAAHDVFRFRDGVVDAVQEPLLEQLWRMLNRARLLTVTRGLPTGSIAINAYLHDRALDRMTMTGRPEFVPGEPVMITANDYQRGLFNGDQGMIVRADEGFGGHRFRAVFRSKSKLVPFAIEALRDRLELAWALTVHKSQGSELDAIALLLPHDDLPLVTRELIYTGVTRARTGAAICGPKKVLEAGARRVALRHSGLRDRLVAAVQSKA